MSTITERVAAGAAFLDEHDPEWWRENVERAIDLNTLDLDSNRTCVLGQRCPLEVLAAHIGAGVHDLGDGDRWRGYIAYSRHLSGLRNTAGWACDHGFNGLDHDEMPILTAEWSRVITERRAS